MSPSAALPRADNAAFRFVEPSPKMVVTCEEQGVDPRIARGLDDLLGLGRRLAGRKQCVEAIDHCGAGLGQLWHDDRIGAPMQLVFGQGVRIFGNAVGLDLLPSGDLPGNAPDLGIRRDDDQRRVPLDERLDRRHDAVQEFEQFFFADWGTEPTVPGPIARQPWCSPPWPPPLPFPGPCPPPPGACAICGAARERCGGAR